MDGRARRVPGEARSGRSDRKSQNCPRKCLFRGTTAVPAQPRNKVLPGDLSLELLASRAHPSWQGGSRVKRVGLSRVRVNLPKEVPTLRITGPAIQENQVLKPDRCGSTYDLNVLQWIFSGCLTGRWRGTTLGKIASCLGKYPVRVTRRTLGS